LVYDRYRSPAMTLCGRNRIKHLVGYISYRMEDCNCALIDFVHEAFQQNWISCGKGLLNSRCLGIIILFSFVLI
jgi:hypothetical protein